MRYDPTPYTRRHIADIPSIGKSDDELGRMLEVLRFWFTKDLVRMPLL